MTGPERKYEEGRRAGLLEAARQLEEEADAAQRINEPRKAWIMERIVAGELRALAGPGSSRGAGKRDDVDEIFWQEIRREAEDVATVVVARQAPRSPWTAMGTPPPESRLVLLAIYHEAEPEVMREFVIGSWRQIDESKVWYLDKKGEDFEKWGYRLLAWMPLPEWPVMQK